MIRPGKKCVMLWVLNIQLFTDWVKGNSYPRIDKIELMANYFGISKADLVEDHNDMQQSEMPYYLNDETRQIAPGSF